MNEDKEAEAPREAGHGNRYNDIIREIYELSKLTKKEFAEATQRITRSGKYSETHMGQIIKGKVPADYSMLAIALDATNRSLEEFLCVPPRTVDAGQEKEIIACFSKLTGRNRELALEMLQKLAQAESATKPLSRKPRSDR